MSDHVFDPTTAGDERAVPAAATRSWVTAIQVAGLTSIGAGAIHAAAIGIHAEHPNLARIFVAVAAAQLAVGLVTLLRGGRAAAALTILVNVGAVAGWAVTRVAGISWISGLEEAESPQFADTACAALGAVAVLAAFAALLTGRTSADRRQLGVPAIAVGAISIWAMMLGGTHVHSHDGGGGSSAGAAAHGHSGDGADDHHDETATAASTPSTDHPHDDTAAEDAHGHDETATAGSVPVDHGHDETATDGTHGHTEEEPVVDAAAWPRAWDPTAPIDFSGVPGVTAEQEARAEALVQRTLDRLPQFADVTRLAGLGYRSIGDSSTGFEHFINYGYLGDDGFLDPDRPESLVYQVDGETRTLVSAMYIANATPLDDPDLVDYGGELMQWHNHDNLCWIGTDDGPKVVGVTDAQGNCPPGSVNAGGENPMVHVWIAPHECGAFAALEGHGAGQTDPATGARTDQCTHGHGEGDGGHTDHEAAPAPVPYDPTKPIDLSGTPGVTLEQQAFAENLIARTVVDLPQWSDPAVAEQFGFRSIGDGGTGHEHYIQWDWINDDVWLDPDFPESLVFEPQPDGTKKLVSAMYMLPDTMTLDQVPDFGGALMQWHIHDNLCFTDDPEAPQVRGITNADGTCSAPLVKLGEAPMIHVWIEPNPCGPFAALEGLGAGAILPGQERLCDTAHGGH